MSVGAWTRSVVAWTLLSASAGAANALTVIGWRAIDPTNISWLMGDPATSWLGWAFFRQEKHLTLPLGWASMAGYPLGEPAAYFDSIPIVATFFWFLGGALPDPFQYLGLYFVLASALQFFFGARIARRVCGGDWLAGILGGLVFLVAPPFIFRASGHFALTSHWLILAAIDQLLEPPRRLSAARIARAAATCFIAAAINPYIAAITWLVSCAFLARALIRRDADIGRVLAALAGTVATVLLAFVLFGFIVVGDASQYVGTGYGLASMNLVAPIDPEKWASLLLLEQQIGPIQYEGYNYLGLGVLLLGLVSFARRPGFARILLRRSVAPALAVVAISLTLALSTRVTAGSHVLLDPSLPKPVLTALSFLRSSGRLFWPGYYLIFAGILAAASAAFGRQTLRLALAVTLIVQILDINSLRRYIFEQWSAGSVPTVPRREPWNRLGATQPHLVIEPAWQCFNQDGPGGSGGYATFGELAVRQRMTINSVYVGRMSDEQTRSFCVDQPASLASTGLRQDTAYVFKANGAVWLFGLPLDGKYCRLADGYTLCSNEQDVAGLDPALLDAVRLLRTGDDLSFGQPGKSSGASAEALAGFGWSIVEPTGRWAMGPESNLTFKVPGMPCRDVQMELRATPFVVPSHPRQRVNITANGEAVVAEVFTKPETRVPFSIPARAIGPDGMVRLVLHAPDAVSPTAVKLAMDNRVVSLFVEALRVIDDGACKPAGPEPMP